jgi:hypothetical protein
MLQHNQIGIYRKRQSIIDAKLNMTFVTPTNEHYKLVSANREGNKRVYVYEWIDCPEEIKAITSNRLQSLTELTLLHIINWIAELKQLTE